MSTEELLLDYATRYVANLPLSVTHAIAELLPLEREVSVALNDPEWYCDPWPGREHVVTFYSWVPPAGHQASWSVDTQTRTVTPLAGQKGSKP